MKPGRVTCVIWVTFCPGHVLSRSNGSHALFKMPKVRLGLGHKGLGHRLGHISTVIKDRSKF